MNAWWLALAHMRFHWKRSLLLTGCTTLCLLLPLLIPKMVQRIESELYRRSDSIPLVVGSPQSSPLDLALHGLYFRSQEVPTLEYRHWQDLSKLDPESIVPIHSRFITRDQNQSFPIVGTHLEYTLCRQLSLMQGQWFATLGDCVVGSNVARQWGLQVGGHVVSSPESVVSLSAAYPVQLNIVGILEPSGSVDDDIVLVDIKTAWVLENLGHGHQDVANSNDPNLILERNDQGTIASPAVVPFTRITDENQGSFHFHGDTAQFPITAILALDRQPRTLDLLSGKCERSPELQAVTTHQEVGRLLAVIFQVQWLLLAVVMIVGLATLLLFGLVMALSVQIRSREMQTMYKLGASRGFTFQLHAAEIATIFLGSLAMAAVATFLILANLNDQWIQWVV